MERHTWPKRHHKDLWTAASGDAVSNMHSVGVFKMMLIEFVLIWAQSLQEWLRKQGVQLDFGQSPDDRLKLSCWVNLRQGENESELLLWDSGEAELNSSEPSTGISQEHYEHLGLTDLASVLSRLLSTLE
jgi:hypothetical protein